MSAWSEVRYCDTCNRPIRWGDMQYELDGVVLCEAHAPAGAFDDIVEDHG